MNNKNVESAESKFQIIGTRIISLDIKNDFVHIDSDDNSIEREIGVSYETNVPVDISDDEDILAGCITLYIDINISDSEENKFTINLVIEGCFTLEDSKDEDKIKEMIEINGCASLYSIARGIISSVSSHVCSGGATLIPLINTFELRELMENDE